MAANYLVGMVIVAVSWTSCSALKQGLTGPADSDPVLECAIKNLLLEYAQVIQPKVNKRL